MISSDPEKCTIPLMPHPQGEGSQAQVQLKGVEEVGTLQWAFPYPHQMLGECSCFPHVGISTCDTCHIKGISPGPGWAGRAKATYTVGYLSLSFSFIRVSTHLRARESEGERENPRRRPRTMKMRQLQDQKRRPRPTPLASSCRHNPTSNRRDGNFKIRALHVTDSQQPNSQQPKCLEVNASIQHVRKESVSQWVSS